MPFHRLRMADTKESEIKKLLERIGVQKRVAFDEILKSIWYSTSNIEKRLSQLSIDRTVQQFSAGVEEFASEAIEGSLLVSKSSGSFALVYDSIFNFFIDALEMVYSTSADATEEDTSDCFGHTVFPEIRRRLEKKVDLHRARFTGDNNEHGDADKPGAKKSGRPKKYDWTKAACIVWGEIYRGDFEPKLQKDIEERLISILSRGDDIPNAETVRPTASLIMQEIQYDPQDKN